MVVAEAGDMAVVSQHLVMMEFQHQMEDLVVVVAEEEVQVCLVQEDHQIKHLEQDILDSEQVEELEDQDLLVGQVAAAEALEPMALIRLLQTLAVMVVLENNILYQEQQLFMQAEAEVAVEI
jgi:hypothetical protein